MKTLRVPAMSLLVLTLAYLALLGGSAAMLPERVASHFNASGQADGWMARNAYLSFTGVMGLALPVFIVGVCYATRFLPDWTINVPHKEYWLAPERRALTCDYVFSQSLWLGCLILLQFAGLHWLTIQANQRQPPALPGTGFAILMGAFVAGIGCWVLLFVRHFRRPRS